MAEPRASLQDLLAVVEPGETLTYQKVIDRLKFVGRPTSGIGLVFEQIAFRGHTGAWRGSEVVSYREPYFDTEAEGDWTEGTMYVRRRDV